MTQEYKFGDAILVQEGKLWSDDPKVYALIVENERLREAVKAEREACAKENAELLQALQNLHQRCHWADAPEEMDAAKAAIDKAIRARGEV